MSRKWVAGVILAVALLAGCGGEDSSGTSAKPQESGPKLRKLAITLAGWKGPESAGVMMADARGYFAEVGLKVFILTPETPARPVKYVVERTDDFGVSHQPQVVLAKEKGAPIVAVGSLIPQPTATMIWLGRSNIDGIADLRGKTIAIPGLSFQEDFLRIILAQAGLTLGDVKVKIVEHDLVESLVGGSADAIFGGSWNVEGRELRSRGLDPVITPVGKFGIPPYEEMVWITRTDFAAENPQVVRDFLSAVRRGTAAAIADPKAAAKVIDTAFETNPEFSREEMEAGVEVTLPLVSKTGRMSPGRASRLVDWMRGRGLIQREVPISTLLTNEYTR